jgi:hypothetical protein
MAPERLARLDLQAQTILPMLVARDDSAAIVPEAEC